MDRRADLLIALLVLVVSVAYFVLADRSYGPRRLDPLGEGGLPKVVAVLMAAGSIAVIGRRLIRLRREPGNTVEPEGEEDEPGQPVSTSRPVVLWALAMLYLVALPLVGFLIATPMLLTIAAWTWTRHDWRQMVGLAGGLTAVVYLLFAVLLEVRLP